MNFIQRCPCDNALIYTVPAVYQLLKKKKKKKKPCRVLFNWKVKHGASTHPRSGRVIMWSPRVAAGDNELNYSELKGASLNRQATSQCFFFSRLPLFINLVFSNNESFYVNSLFVLPKVQMHCVREKKRGIDPRSNPYSITCSGQPPGCFCSHLVDKRRRVGHD